MCDDAGTIRISPQTLGLIPLPRNNLLSFLLLVVFLKPIPAVPTKR